MAENGHPSGRNQAINSRGRVFIMPTVTVTEVLRGMPPGEVRPYLAQRGLGGRGGDAPPTLPGPAGPVPRAAVRHVALEIALWEGGRDDPTAAEAGSRVRARGGDRPRRARGPGESDGVSPRLNTGSSPCAGEATARRG